MQDSFFPNFSRKCSLSHIFCISNETCQFRTRPESTCKNVYADSRVAGFKSRYNTKSDRYGYSVTGHSSGSEKYSSKACFSILAFSSSRAFFTSYSIYSCFSFSSSLLNSSRYPSKKFKISR